MDTKVVTAHIPLDLAAKVDAAAVRIERSRGWIVKQALAAWVNEEDERHRMTLEALAEVDAGRLISDEAMAAWVDSLSTDTPLPRPVA